jgi:UDP-glucuronate 4-epimerase
MSVLVTGGAGFIGSHFIEWLLARDAESRVVCLDNFNDYYAPRHKRANVALFAADPRVKIVEGTFCDAAAMRQVFAAEQVRRVVHLGAYAGVRASIAHPLIYEEVNVRGTLVLLEAARAAGVERFLLISSSTVYGGRAQIPFQEDAPLGIPLSPYGATKQAAELLCQTYQHLHGLPTVRLRPFNVYGPRIRPDLALYVFARAMIEGRGVPLYGDGSVRRDFTHVSDVCEGLGAALTAPQAVGQAINLGHHAPISMRELLTQLEQTIGRKAIVERRPAVAGDMPVTCADLTKAQRLLAYSPRIALADGLRDFVAWLRNQSAD